MNERHILVYGIAIGIAISMVVFLGCAAAFPTDAKVSINSADVEQVLCLPGYSGGQPVIAASSVGDFPVYISWPTTDHYGLGPWNYHLKTFSPSQLKLGVDYQLDDCK